MATKIKNNKIFYLTDTDEIELDYDDIRSIAEYYLRNEAKMKMCGYQRNWTEDEINEALDYFDDINNPISAVKDVIERMEFMRSQR